MILREVDEEMINYNESLEKNNKQQEYLEYIKDHINNVNKMFELYFIPLLERDFICPFISDEEFKDAIRKCSINIPNHDLSKFGEEEFDGYREKYYPTSMEKADSDFQRKVDERSEEAWIHHYNNNPHHPAYWVNNENNIETINDMDLEYIIEMICDWGSFSLKKGDITELPNWYKNKAYEEKEHMTDNTKHTVEWIIENIVHHS